MTMATEMLDAGTLTERDREIAAAEAAYARSRAAAAWRRRTLPAVGLVFFIGLWALLVYGLDVKPYVAPSPVLVGQTLWVKLPLLMNNLMPTAIEAVCGFLLGNFAAILIATVFVHSKSMEEAFFPAVVVFNAIPVVAKAPILILIFGYGYEPKIIIAALISFFPTLVNMVRGLQSVNPQAMELMRVLSASKREIFFKLRLLNSLPYLFSALKISASTSVIGAIVAEYIGSTQGIGALIVQATYAFDSALLYATIVVGSCFSMVFFLVITVAERLVVRWQPSVGH